MFCLKLWFFWDLIYSLAIINHQSHQTSKYRICWGKFPLFWTLRGLKLSNYNHIFINLKLRAAEGTDWRENPIFINESKERISSRIDEVRNNSFCVTTTSFSTFLFPFFFLPVHQWCQGNLLCNFFWRLLGWFHWSILRTGSKWLLCGIWLKSNFFRINSFNKLRY